VTHTWLSITLMLCVRFGCGPDAVVTPEDCIVAISLSPRNFVERNPDVTAPQQRNDPIL
jgi:hypothetical protein